MYYSDVNKCTVPALPCFAAATTLLLLLLCCYSAAVTDKFVG